MPDIAYVDGGFVPLERARVPLTDRAYYFADAVYEVLTTFGGKLFMFEAHLDRLERSLKGVRIKYVVDRRLLAEIFAEGMEQAGYRESLVYLQISRGCAMRDKRFPSTDRGNLVVTFSEKPAMDTRRFERGIDAIVMPDERWGHCDYKTIMLLPNVLAHQAAIDRGKDDAIFVDPESGRVHEATSANVFLVRDGRLVTPAECARILPGTVRRHLIDLARRHGIDITERPVGVEELLEAHEVFLSGTTTEVLGVVSIDDRRIGQGLPGPLTRRLHRLFQESVGCHAPQPTSQE